MRNHLVILAIIFLYSCSRTKFAIVKLNGKFGTINRKGKIVIKPTWDYILQGSKEELNLVEKDSLYGFVNDKGDIIIKPQYKEAHFFSEGFAAVNNGKKYGFINTKGDTVIPFIYDDVFMGFNNGLSDVTINDSSGYIDRQGKLVVPLIYRTCYPFMSAYAEVETFDGEEWLIDKKGRKHGYGDVSEKHRLWVPREVYPGSFTTSTGQGRVNSNGDTIVPPIYLVTGNLSNHMYILQDKNKKWGAYDDKGTLKVKPQFDWIWHFHEGLANFSINEKYGYVNRQGKIVIASVFDYAGEFTDGIAYVEQNGKAGFINKKGKWIIKPKFQINEWKSNFK